MNEDSMDGIEVSGDGDSVHISEAKAISIIRAYLDGIGVQVGPGAFLVGVTAAREDDKGRIAHRVPRLADGGVTLQWDPT